jgi:hypothetical protein
MTIYILINEVSGDIYQVFDNYEVAEQHRQMLSTGCTSYYIEEWDVTLCE